MPARCHVSSHRLMHEYDLTSLPQCMAIIWTNSQIAVDGEPSMVAETPERHVEKSIQSQSRTLREMNDTRASCHLSQPRRASCTQHEARPIHCAFATRHLYCHVVTRVSEFINVPSVSGMVWVVRLFVFGVKHQSTAVLARTDIHAQPQKNVKCCCTGRFCRALPTHPTISFHADLVVSLHTLIHRPSTRRQSNLSSMKICHATSDHVSQGEHVYIFHSRSCCVAPSN